MGSRLFASLARAISSLRRSPTTRSKPANVTLIGVADPLAQTGDAATAVPARLAQ